MTFEELAERPAHEIMEYVKELHAQQQSIELDFGDEAAGNYIIIRILQRAAEGKL